MAKAKPKKRKTASTAPAKAKKSTSAKKPVAKKPAKKAAKKTKAKPKKPTVTAKKTAAKPPPKPRTRAPSAAAKKRAAEEIAREKRAKIARQNGQKGGRPRKQDEDDEAEINANYAAAFANLSPAPEQGDPFARTDWCGEVAQILAQMSIAGTADPGRHGQIRADLGIGLRSVPIERLAAAERLLKNGRQPKKPVAKAGAKAQRVAPRPPGASRRSPIRG